MRKAMFGLSRIVTALLWVGGGSVWAQTPVPT